MWKRGLLDCRALAASASTGGWQHPPGPPEQKNPSGQAPVASQHVSPGRQQNLRVPPCRESPGQQTGASGKQAPPPRATGQQVKSVGTQTPNGCDFEGGQHWGEDPPHEPPPCSTGQQLKSCGLQVEGTVARPTDPGFWPSRAAQHLGNSFGQQPSPHVMGRLAGQVSAGASGQGPLVAPWRKKRARRRTTSVSPLKQIKRRLRPIGFSWRPLAELCSGLPRMDAASAAIPPRTKPRRDLPETACRTSVSNMLLSTCLPFVSVAPAVATPDRPRRLCATPWVTCPWRGAPRARTRQRRPPYPMQA